MKFATYLAVLASFTASVSAGRPKLPSLNTQVQSTGPPTPNNDWPKTWTNGEQRQRHGSESPTVLGGSPIGSQRNYGGGSPHTPPNTPTSRKRKHDQMNKRDLLRREIEDLVMRYAEPEPEPEFDFEDELFTRDVYDDYFGYY